MSGIYLALGSNLGDRHKNIAYALKLLEESGIHILQEASIIETKPVGGPPQGKFLNTVIHISTEFSPEKLLLTVKSIEQKMGRATTVRNGARIIDIDILLYGDVILNTQQLIIPHPRMFERPFVMKPLNEIAPDINKNKFYADH